MPTARNTSALLTFFVVTYLVTWGSWLAASSIAAGAPRQLLFFLGVFAPGSAALWPRFGSLLPVMLMHAAVNNTKDIVPSAEPNATNPWAPSHSLVAWLSVALLSLCAGYFLLRMRKNPQLAREVAHSVAT